MQHAESFKSNKTFFAQDLYPHGISRSGDFTRYQSELLEKHGGAYQALHSGERKPINVEERNFIKVCKGQKPPQTEHEIVWLRFYEKSQKRHIRAFSGSYIKSSGDNHTAEDDWAPEI